MILFFDAVSSLPEISLIEDNKIVYSKKIINNFQEKLSDCIISDYLNLKNKVLLNKSLKLLIVNTGPGSYTALRVSIAFLSGLSISQKIGLKGVSCIELFRYALKNHEQESTALYIESSNNQKFICFYDNKKKGYTMNKMENDLNKFNFKDKSIKKILGNSSLKLKNVSYQQFNFKDLVNNNIQKILQKPNEDIIKPIYVSNNEILN